MAAPIQQEIDTAPEARIIIFWRGVKSANGVEVESFASCPMTNPFTKSASTMSILTIKAPSVTTSGSSAIRPIPVTAMSPSPTHARLCNRRTFPAESVSFFPRIYATPSLSASIITIATNASERRCSASNSISIIRAIVPRPEAEKNRGVATAVVFQFTRCPS